MYCFLLPTASACNATTGVTPGRSLSLSGLSGVNVSSFLAGAPTVALERSVPTPWSCGGYNAASTAAETLAADGAALAAAAVPGAALAELATWMKEPWLRLGAGGGTVTSVSAHPQVRLPWDLECPIAKLLWLAGLGLNGFLLDLLSCPVAVTGPLSMSHVVAASLGLVPGVLGVGLQFSTFRVCPYFWLWPLAVLGPCLWCSWIVSWACLWLRRAAAREAACGWFTCCLLGGWVYCFPVWPWSYPEPLVGLAWLLLLLVVGALLPSAPPSVPCSPTVWRCSLRDVCAAGILGAWWLWPSALGVG